MEERVAASDMLNFSTLELEELCRSEIESDCLRDPGNALFSFELLRRATLPSNPDARVAWQRCFSEVLRGWLHLHTHKEGVYQFDLEESYIAKTFEQFWQIAAAYQQRAFSELPTALRYLQASLYGILLDSLRDHVRLREIVPIARGNSGKRQGEDDTDGRQLWECIQYLLPHVHEQRVAYLLFHCHLSPREILRYTPQEFGDVQEICHLRCQIFEEILQGNIRNSIHRSF